MPATIQSYEILKEYIHQQTEVTVEAGQTVRASMLALGIPPDLVALVTVNDVQQTKD
jgi:hypothetical protein